MANGKIPDKRAGQGADPGGPLAAIIVSRNRAGIRRAAEAG